MVHKPGSPCKIPQVVSNDFSCDWYTPSSPLATKAASTSSKVTTTKLLPNLETLLLLAPLVAYYSSTVPGAMRTKASIEIRTAGQLSASCTTNVLHME
mmetsp:Transcript_15428/g.45852  ORF Transcript_15428/g.45852 Transcript_15428/m.45852 type:complete len:98 (+) Transcript_15428:28-321(+)